MKNKWIWIVGAGAVIYFLTRPKKNTLLAQPGQTLTPTSV